MLANKIVCMGCYYQVVQQHTKTKEKLSYYQTKNKTNYFPSVLNRFFILIFPKVICLKTQKTEIFFFQIPKNP